MSATKKGTPTRAVMMPMGTAMPGTTVIDTAWAAARKAGSSGVRAE